MIAKRLFKKNLSSRMQYNLWFILLGLLAVPFIPLRPIGLLFSWFGNLSNSPSLDTETIMGESASTNWVGTTHWMNDFTLSVSRETPSATGLLLFWTWIVVIFAMILLVIKSSRRLSTLKKSALPLQNSEVRRLYDHCLKETGITKAIPICSTAF